MPVSFEVLIDYVCSKKNEATHILSISATVLSSQSVNTVQRKAFM